MQTNQCTLYMSHSIFGDNGDIFCNCEKATRVANKIRKTFPEIKVYCPAESELVLWTLRDMGVLGTEDILSADCKILRACHGWFWWYTGPSKGCEQELQAAFEIGLTPIVGRNTRTGEIIQDLLKANYGEVRRILSPIVDAAITRFRKGN